MKQYLVESNPSIACFLTEIPVKYSFGGLDYFCSILEEKMGTACAFETGIRISGITVLRGDESTDDILQQMFEKLEPLCEGNSICIGFSDVFNNILELKQYMKQAANVLDTMNALQIKKTVSSIRKMRLSGFLLNMTGNLQTLETIFPPELKALMKLANEQNASDYWTILKTFLDNEMNATKTAKDLYLHRSTLLQRIDKIRNIVNLDTPESRLELRMCIYFSEMLKNRQ